MIQSVPELITLHQLASDSIAHDLFHIEIPPLEKVIRTAAVYFGIAVIIRFAGKRLMAQMNSLDLVVVLLLSNVVQNAIIGADNSLSGGLLGAVVLVALNWVFERAARSNGRVRWLLEGTGTDVIKRGEIDDFAMLRLGMTRQELQTSLREQGADNESEVETASMEPGGSLVVDLKPGARAASSAELQAAVAEIKAYVDARL